MKKQLIFGLTFVLITLSLTFSDHTTAVESDDLSDQETTITGMVIKEGDTIILQGIDGYQCTITGPGLSNMVGEKVQASGKFMREKDKSWFDASKIIELPGKAPKKHQPLKTNRQ